NIWTNALDGLRGLRDERARQLVETLWTSGEGVLSTQVLQELCINLRRKIVRPLELEEVRQIIQDYLSWEIVVNTPASTPHALDIEVRYRISFWDALVLQAAESSGATVLYSEDLATGHKYGPVQVAN